MQEEILRGSPEGRIAVCAAENAALLLIDEQPAALVWREAGRTCWVRGPSTEPLGAGPAICREGLDPDERVSDQLDALPALLTTGRWAVEDVGPILPGPLPPPDDADWGGPHHAAGDHVLLGTRPRPAITRLTPLRARMRDGARPALILVSAEGAPATFVIFGHEALEVASHEDLPVDAVLLTVSRPRPLPPSLQVRALEILLGVPAHGSGARARR